MPTPAAVKPQRLIVLETEGWPRVDAATRGAFESVHGFKLLLASLCTTPARR